MDSAYLVQLGIEHFKQTTVVAVALGAAAYLLRRRPHLAYVCLTLIVIKALVPPIVPSPWAVFGSPAESLASATDEANLQSTVIPPIEPMPGALDAVPAGDLAKALPANPPGSQPRPLASSQLPWIALSVWWGVASCLMFRWLAGWYFARRRWQQTACPLSDDMLELATHVSQRLGFRRAVRVNVNAAGFGPLVSGFFRPEIVLPHALVEKATPQELTATIAHEVIHVRRGDTLLCGLQSIARALWWFHPLIWIANRQLDRICEQCCDEETIAALECRPRSYVASLLRVAELKYAVQHVRGLAGSRPTHVTANRLRSLMHQANFTKRLPTYGYILFVVLACALLPIVASPTASQTTNADTSIDTNVTASADSDESEYSELDADFDAHNWEAAIVTYEDHLQEHPNDHLRKYRLAYAYHLAQRYDEAKLTYHKVIGLPEFRPVAFYNLACLACLDGDLEGAKRLLTESLDAGMKVARPVVADPDFQALIDDPEFQEIAGRFPTAPAKAQHRQMDIWLGEWELISPQGKVLGHSTVTKDAGGFMLVEKWTPIKGDGGTSVTYFDAHTLKWKQTYVSASGPITRCEGRLQDRVLTLAGDTVFPNGVTKLSRAVMTFHGHDRVHLLMEASQDDGESWENDFNGTYVRIRAE